MDDRDQHRRFLHHFVRVQPSLRSYLQTLLRHGSDCDDVLQEVSVVLWERFAEYDEALPFINWSIGIARNHAARWRRARGRGPEWLSPSLEAQLAQTYEELEDDLQQRRDSLLQCVQKLGPQARELLTLRYERGHSLHAIAQLRGTTLNAINKALGKVRDSLARCSELAAHASKATP